VLSFEIRAEGHISVSAESLGCVIPAWSAGIQADMDVSGRILRTWMPAIHAGMTEIRVFHVLWASVSHESLCVKPLR
jgi:hypothetical protein